MAANLDVVLAPIGLLLFLAYHVHLVYRVWCFPKTTIIGVNQISRILWVRTMMADSLRNGVLAVQTLRNNIMASSLLATAAITISSVIAILINSTNDIYTRSSSDQLGNTATRAFWVKLLCALVALLLAFGSHVQSVRYYSHVSFLISIPTAQGAPAGFSEEYVCRNMIRGGQFWSIGLRSFYLSIPLFLWLFGPISMFICCVLIVAILHFVDTSYDVRHSCLAAPAENTSELV